MIDYQGALAHHKDQTEAMIKAHLRLGLYWTGCRMFGERLLTMYTNGYECMHEEQLV